MTGSYDFWPGSTPEDSTLSKNKSIAVNAAIHRQLAINLSENNMTSNLRKIAVRVSCLITLFTVSAVIAAGSTANVSWIAPATYSDGSNLPASDIDHYTVSWAPVGNQGGTSGTLSVPGSTTTATVTLPCGSTSFSVTLTTGPNAKYANMTSTPDGPVSYATGITCTPNPPSGLAVH